MSRLLPIVAISAVLVLTACGDDGTPSAVGPDTPTSPDFETGEQLPDGVAAEVDDVTIATTRVDRRTDAAMDNPQLAEQLPEDPQEARQAVQASVLGQMIVTEAVLKAGEADGIEVTDDDLAAEREQLEQQAGGAEALQEQIDAIGLDEDELDKELRSLAVLDAVAERNAADAGASPAPTSPEQPDHGQIAVQEWMTAQVTAMDIGVDPAYGQWDPQSLQVVPPGAEQQPVAPPNE